MTNHDDAQRTEIETRTKDFDVLWIGALQYYLGRQTISTHAFCDLLIAEHDALPDQVKLLVLRNLKEAFERDDRDREKERDCFELGHDVDRAKWLNVLSAFSGL
jgi:hypothetical protein